MPARPRGFVLDAEPPQRLGRERDGLVLIVVEQRQQRLGEPGQVPGRDRGLVAVGVAAAVVDRAEHGGRVEGVHERARTVVDGLAGDRHVVGVHHAVDEPDEHPLRDQRGLRGDHPVEEREVRVVRPPRRPGSDGRSRSRPAGAAGPRSRRPPRTGTSRPAGGWRRRGRAPRRAAACRGRPARPSPTTASARVVGMPSACIASLMTYSRSIGPTAAMPSPPRENGVRTRALQVQVATGAVRVDELAEQQRPTVAEPRAEPAELVTGVRLGHRGGAVGHDVAEQEAQAVGASQPADVEAQLAGQRLVEREQAGFGGVGGLPRNRQLGQLAGEAPPRARRWSPGRWSPHPG